ncbi:MAG: hypothetical protein IK077_01365 [Thermoguttaceae bacterium]|nr:hypothetical protein [Thermoguttaceae bacterium]
MCAKSKEDKEAKKAAAAAAKAEKASKKGAKAKPKKKADAGANEYNFFLLHGEIVIIAVGIALFGALVAMGGGLDKFTLTASQINDTSSRAEENIKNSKLTPKEYDESVVIFDYDKYAELIKSGVKVNSYETDTRWEQSLFPDKVKRPNIKPLPLVNLKATASIGAIMYNEISASNANNMGGGMAGGMTGGGMGGMAGGMAGGGMGGGMSGGMGSTGELKGRKWITLTGSIPIREQQEAYNSVLGAAQYTDDIRDQPRYIYYKLERGVVEPNGKTTWSEVNVIRAMKKENNMWSGVGSDQVGYSYIAPTVSGFPPMAMSCPPMANKPFGEEVANLPNIPLNSTDQIKVQAEQIKEMNQLMEDVNKFDESDLLNRDPFADARSGGMGMSGGMMGGMSGGMTGGMSGGLSGGMGDMAGGMSGGVSGGMGGEMGGGNSWMRNQDAINNSRLKIQQSVSVDYYLFRYFDFEVDPDKTYVYRVKLLLANPNYGVEPRFVEDESNVEQRFVESDFSEISNPVSLGEVSRVYAQKVEASTRPGAEPRITLSSIYFDAEDASESIVQDLAVRRGQVANFMGQSHDPVNVSGGMSADMMMGYGDAGGSSSKKGKPQKKSVNHVSNVCVVDALGGNKISAAKDYASPGKVLILEPNGLMRVREVKEDARELGRYDGSSNQMGFGTGSAGMMM